MFNHEYSGCTSIIVIFLHISLKILKSGTLSLDRKRGVLDKALKPKKRGDQAWKSIIPVHLKPATTGYSLFLRLLA